MPHFQHLDSYSISQRTFLPINFLKIRQQPTIFYIISGVEVETTRNLNLNQDRNKTIEIIEAPADLHKVTPSDTVDISAVLSMVNDIPVKRLTKDEDIDFMRKRITDVYLAVDFEDYNDPTRSLQGVLLIWPDGNIVV